jgi:hypothetical protein
LWLLSVDQKLLAVLANLGFGYVIRFAATYQAGSGIGGKGARKLAGV